MNRVFCVKGTRNRKTGKLEPFNLNDVTPLGNLLSECPDIRLVVIDPISQLVGVAGANDNRETELRALLGPLSEMMNRFTDAGLMIKHLNKSVNSKVIHRIAGSMAYTNLCRCVFAVAPDPEEEKKKYLLPVKFNLAEKPRTIAFRLEDLGEEAGMETLERYHSRLSPENRLKLAKQFFRVKWEGQTDARADDVMAPTLKAGGTNKVVRCSKWMEEFLQQFSFPSNEILEAGKKAGFSFDNIKEAKKLLKDSKGLRNSKKGWNQEWWSGFGDPETWQARPSSVP